MNIIIDDIDISILIILNNLPIKKNHELTTTSLAKKIFPNISNRSTLITRDNQIRSKLRKLNSYGLILIEKKDNINYYDLIADNVEIGKLKNFKSIFLKINGDWCAFTIKN